MIPTNRNPDPWLGLRRPNPQARLRLVCFPHAGGSASMFRPWSCPPTVAALGIPAQVEVCPVQLPGRGSRLSEPPFTMLPPLLSALQDVLLPHLGMPFALLGHSMGALVSFELARHLRRDHGLEPVHLFVSGRRAPQIPDRDEPEADLPDEQFLQELRCRYGSAQPELEDSELLDLMLPTLRADVALCQSYAYSHEPPLGCPITVCGGLQDLAVSRDGLDAWRQQTTARFTLRMFPGDHFFLQTDRSLFLRMVSQELYQILSGK